MALSKEEENFVKVAKIVLDIVPHHLRKLFITKWEEKYQNEKWESNNTSGDALVAKIANVNKNYADKLKAGDEQQWDTTILVYVFLYSGLNLIDECRNPKENRVVPLRISEEIDVIRITRNEFFGHATQMLCQSHDFTAIIDKLKSVARNIFGADAEKEIDDIRKVPIDTQSTAGLRQKMEEEKNRNDQFNQSLKKLKEELEQVRDTVEKMDDKVEKNFEQIREQLKDRSTMKPQPYTEKDIENMKAKYRKKHQKHEIHKVDSNRRIDLKEVNIEEFAVTLTMSDPLPVMTSFVGEAERFIEQLKGRRGSHTKDIKMSDLIDNEHRVTFVSGIAGSGKSVLVKQMTYKWANGELFNDVAVCVTFECRELNYFALNKGKKFEKDELIIEFIRHRFGFDVTDSKNLLFIVDGFDELLEMKGNDTKEEDTKMDDKKEDHSLIGQLLDLTKSKFIESKIIITGRPHIEHKLLRQGKNIGGVRKVEIIGLSDKQIDEYIRKFATSNEDDIAKIKKVKDSSKSNLKLYYVPQFLNSICCVALLSEKAEIRNAAELYCWSFYLLLKQHAEKDVSRDKRIPEIFKEYSKYLLALSKICHELLNKNTIIFEGNIEKQFCDFGKGEEFLRGLFVDMSDNFIKRVQFKHLTLMEFLSAVYVCTTENSNEIIKDILRKRSDQVLFFYCELMSGLMYDGIIKQLFENATKLMGSDAERFFGNILTLISECVSNRGDDAFGLSVDVIMCLINNDGISKQFILSIVNKLSFKDVSSIDNLIEIMKPLVDKFECSKLELQKAFEFVHFRLFYEVNKLKYAKFLASVDEICIRSFYGMVKGRMAEKIMMSVRDIRNEIEECERLTILYCELQDEDADEEITESSKVKYLTIVSCTFNKQSFFYLCKWMITSLVEEFRLVSITGMKVEWWRMLVDAIVKAKEDGALALRELEIAGCPLMNKEMKEKIVQCGLTLDADDEVMHSSQAPRDRSLVQPRDRSPPQPRDRSPPQARNRCCTLI